MRSPLSLLLLSAGLFSAIAFAENAGAPLAQFECREWLGRNWRGTVVTYAVEWPAGRFRPGPVRLVDPEGKSIPGQLWAISKHPDGSISRANVSFFTALSKDGSYRYELRPGTAPAGENGAVKITKKKDSLTLDNGVTAIRLPPAGKQAFDPPLQFAAKHDEVVRLSVQPEDAGIAPGPIQGIRLADGQWVGRSYFFAAQPGEAPKVLARTCEITESGPVFTEAKVTYQFDGDRQYAATIQMRPGDPAVVIDEQFDLHAFEKRNLWQMRVSLSRGWETGGFKPDYAYWERGREWGFLQQPAPTQLNEWFTAAGYKLPALREKPFGNHLIQPDPKKEKTLFPVEVWSLWAANAYFFGLVDHTHLLTQPAEKALASFLDGATSDKGSSGQPPDKDLTPLLEDANSAKGTTTQPLPNQDRIPFIAVVPIHAGNWRADGLTDKKKLLVAHPGGDVAMHWPLNVSPFPISAFYSGEADPALPLTFVRRQWALIAGPLQYLDSLDAYRNTEGYVNLDYYKDWVLDWPADPQVTYPRLVLNAEQVGALKEKLNSIPEGQSLAKRLYFTPDAKRQEELWKKRLSPDTQWSGPKGHARTLLSHWFVSFRQTQQAKWIFDAEEFLSSPDVPPEQRQAVRAWIAATAYLLAEPDVNPRGTTVHLGFPNMTICRTVALGMVAALIPDHPQAAEWNRASREFSQFALARYTAPGGGWYEVLTYYLAGAGSLLHAAEVQNATGSLPEDTRKVAEELGAYPLNFATPKDPRFGSRMVVNWGHEGITSFSQWLTTAGLAQGHNPELARTMAWLWDQTGRQTDDFHDDGFSSINVAYAAALNDLPAGWIPPQMKSAWIPGIGATLRAHVGDPDETFLSYRLGYMDSHSDNNQNDFVLYAKGAPLVGMSIHAYPLHQNPPYTELDKAFGWHSIVRFGSRDNNQTGGARSSAQIQSHFFSEPADYLRSAPYSAGPQNWTRQILFLRGQTAAGPNYFVFRDSFAPEGSDKKPLQPKFWTIRTPGLKDRMKVSDHALNYTADNGTALDVRFLQPAAITAESRDAARSNSLQFGAAAGWRDQNLPAESKKKSVVEAEESLTVTSVGPIDAGEDVVAVLYPRKPDEAAPRYEMLADGAARLLTPEGTDYVFLSARPLQFEQGDVAFSGTAGAVRLSGDQVHLVIAQGPGTVRYKRLTLKSSGAAAQSFPLAEAGKPRLVEIPAPQTTLDFALDPKEGPIEQVEPGVSRQQRADGSQAYEFRFDEPAKVGGEGIPYAFHGRHGGLVVNVNAGTARAVAVDASLVGWNSIGGGRNAAGPWEVTLGPEQAQVKAEGPARILTVSRPQKVLRPFLTMDGRSFATGMQGGLQLPVGAGFPEATINAQKQPAIFRNPLAWPEKVDATTVKRE